MSILMASVAQEIVIEVSVVVLLGVGCIVQLARTAKRSAKSDLVSS
ncbi:MAG: hypothetical protein J6V21_00660 [Alistipes sp.]|nr:hypothetical protein [Alistipes sp.]